MLSPNSVGVYVDTDTCQYHFNNTKFHNIVYFNDIEEFLRSNFKIRYAAFHVPFDKHNNGWIDRINLLYDFVDKIFIFCSELHEHTVQHLCKLDKPKVVIFPCGIINFSFRNAKIYRWLDWFVTSTYFYQHVHPTLLVERLEHDKPKRHFFDILLGCQRPHRDFVYDFIHTRGLQEKNIITYFRRWNVDLRETEHIFESKGLEFLDESKLTHSVHQVKYYGTKINLSQIVPVDIYNYSYYSLVAETNAVNEFNFYTEKIVKPILAKRLFIVIAGQGYLNNLRSFGFKTFDGIIDESYDYEENNFKRFDMAMAQVEYLHNVDPTIIQEKIKDIVKHNHDLMLGRDWYKEVTVSLEHELE